MIHGGQELDDFLKSIDKRKTRNSLIAAVGTIALLLYFGGFVVGLL